MYKITVFSVKGRGGMREGMMLKQLIFIYVEHKHCNFFMHEYTCKMNYNRYVGKHLIGQQSFA